MPRFTEQNVEAWRTTGFTLIPEFFTAEEIAPVLDDFDLLYGNEGDGDGQAADRKAPGQLGNFHGRQFKHFDQLPYAASPAINLLTLHPQLIAFAQALLGVPRVHCYQSHTWAKYTGEADYDQPFHCDFGNHTLTVPGEAEAERAVDFVIYLTDVTDDLGALHYVTKPDAEAVLGPGVLVVPEEAQLALKARERSAAGPSGTLLAHGIDTLHRGTNLTRPGGHRFTMTTAYKAAGNDMIGFHVWQFSPERPWQLVLEHASPEQLAVLGIPEPGDGFWTPRTLAQTRARWPGWDLAPWEAAL